MFDNGFFIFPAVRLVLCGAEAFSAQTEARSALDFPLLFLALCPLSLFLFVYGLVALYYWDPIHFANDAIIGLVVASLSAICATSFKHVGHVMMMREFTTKLQLQVQAEAAEPTALSGPLIDSNTISSEQAASMQQAQADLNDRCAQWTRKVRSCYEQLSVVSLLLFFAISYALPVRKLVEIGPYFPVDADAGVMQFIDPFSLPFDCWGQHVPTLISHRCPTLSRTVNGSQVLTAGCFIVGWIEADDEHWISSGMRGFAVQPLAEGEVQFNFEVECSSSAMVAASTYELEFHCCFGATHNCDFDGVQATAYFSSRGSVVYVTRVSVAVVGIVVVALTVVAATIMLILGKLLERQSKEFVTRIAELNGQPILPVLQQLGMVEDRKSFAKTVVIVFVCVVLLVALCALLAMESEK